MMMQIDVTASRIDERFITNGNGTYLFVLDNGVAKQLSCDSGFNSLRRIKKAIRDHLVYKNNGESIPRLTYKIVGNDDRWQK